ncbi:hypothetical protein DSECCO2_480590 [anaerobic digester metagenome]
MICCQVISPAASRADATLAPATKLPNWAAMMANPSAGTGKTPPAPCIITASRSKTPALMRNATMMMVGMVILRRRMRIFFEDVHAVLSASRRVTADTATGAAGARGAGLRVIRPTTMMTSVFARPASISRPK